MWNLPGPGMEPVSPALAGRFLNHWTTREVPLLPFRKKTVVQVSSAWLCPVDLSNRVREEKDTSQERQGRGCWRGGDGRGWSRSQGARAVQPELWENIWGTRKTDVCPVCRGWEGRREEGTKRGKGMLRSYVEIMHEIFKWMKSLTFLEVLNKHLNCFFFFLVGKGNDISNSIRIWDWPQSGSAFTQVTFLINKKWDYIIIRIAKMYCLLTICQTAC